MSNVVNALKDVIQTIIAAATLWLTWKAQRQSQPKYAPKTNHWKTIKTYFQKLLMAPSFMLVFWVGLGTWNLFHAFYWIHTVTQPFVLRVAIGCSQIVYGVVMAAVLNLSRLFRLSIETQGKTIDAIQRLNEQ